MISQSEGPTGHVGTRRDSKWDTILRRWDTILPWMGHHFVQMGHKMGHHSAQMGHHFAKMGHEGIPTDIKMVSHVVMVKR
jgi:hypothetical protein